MVHNGCVINHVWIWLGKQMSNIMEYIVQMSQQMKDLAEDGDTKLNQVLERLDELERLIAELNNKMV